MKELIDKILLLLQIYNEAIPFSEAFGIIYWSTFSLLVNAAYFPWFSTYSNSTED